MHNSENVQVGAKVLILEPVYVAGKTGVVRCLEQLSDGRLSDRWLIEVNAENIVVSLACNEFQVIS
ncbi:hypothetical protein BLD44_018695 [Mastigocladus laminosus UU774]|nr:MAG: hypothetical protein C6Y22_04110 [Hapalosiphonaceae cyanobacterium JJU2]TBR57240.1 hypothetical protein B4U84_14490 [Westiellopsis prolifica IICB1]TFI52755.1 hypothetical protein BLD44_018695 [Mastigocladus laminosus UU774]